MAMHFSQFFGAAIVLMGIILSVAYRITTTILLKYLSYCCFCITDFLFIREKFGVHIEYNFWDKHSVIWVHHIVFLCWKLPEKRKLHIQASNHIVVPKFMHLLLLQAPIVITVSSGGKWKFNNTVTWEIIHLPLCSTTITNRTISYWLESLNNNFSDSINDCTITTVC